MIYIAETYKDINTIVEICSTRLTTAPRWLNMQRHLQLFISLNKYSMIYNVEIYKGIFSCLSVWTTFSMIYIVETYKDVFSCLSVSSVDLCFIQLFICLNTFSMIYIVETYKDIFSCLSVWNHSVWFILLKHTKTSSVVYLFEHIQYDLCWSNIQRHLQLFICLNTFSMTYIVETYKDIFSCLSVWSHSVWFILLKHTKASSVVYQFEHIQYDLYCWNIQRHLQLFIGLNRFSMIYIVETYKGIFSWSSVWTHSWFILLRHVKNSSVIYQFEHSMIYIVETYKDIFSCLSVWTNSVRFILLKHAKASSADYQFEHIQYDLYYWDIQRHLQLFISLNTFSMIYIVETYKCLFSCLTCWTHSVWFILLKHTKTSSVVYQFEHIQYDLYCWNIQMHLQLSMNTSVWFILPRHIETYRHNCRNMFDAPNHCAKVTKHAKASSVVCLNKSVWFIIWTKAFSSMIRYDLYCRIIQRHIQLFITLNTFSMIYIVETYKYIFSWLLL